MKKYLNFLLVLVLPVILSGCLSAKEQHYKFDFDSGNFEINYHDVRSQKDPHDKKDPVPEDWATLKQALDKKDDFDPHVVSVTSKKIFQEGGVLSGTALYQVQCPKCFPSRLDVLKLLYDDGQWQDSNNEILLILPANNHLIYTNGTLLKSAGNYIGVWPSDTKTIEFTIAQDNSHDVSLLNKYLIESKEGKI